MTEDEAQGRLRRLTPDQLGAFGEDIWKNVLAESGWLYIPLARIADGGAPMARRNGEAIILPDYQACKDGKSGMELILRITCITSGPQRQVRCRVQLALSNCGEKRVTEAGFIGLAHCSLRHCETLVIREAKTLKHLQKFTGDASNFETLRALRLSSYISLLTAN
jgi:hypothetical protein